MPDLRGLVESCNDGRNFPACLTSRLMRRLWRVQATSGLYSFGPLSVDGPTY
jgi:hypothetical protein